MMSDYPTKYELLKIRKWDAQDPKGLVEYLQEHYWRPEWGISIKRGRTFYFANWVMRVKISTGGWSGNEDRILALKKSWFWFFYWVQSRRGGHYTFEVPVKRWRDKI